MVGNDIQPNLVSNDSNGVPHNFSQGGFHLATNHWWEPRNYSISSDDWDGDGINNSIDSIPMNNALGLQHSGHSYCISEEVPCAVVKEQFETSNTSSWISENAEGTNALSWSDVDGDGDLDLTFGNDDNIEIYLNSGGMLQNTPEWTIAEGPNPGASSLEWGDIDDDGLLELIVSSNTNVSLYRFENDTYVYSSGWAISSSTNSQVTSSASSVALGDVDDDGDLDLAVGVLSGQNELYINSNGVFSTTPFWTSSNEMDTQSIAWGDVNGDGKVDLAVGNWGSNEIYLNTGNSLALNPYWTSQNTHQTYSVALGDMDNDGDLDLAVANGGGGEFGEPSAVYLNTGSTLDSTPIWSDDWSGGLYFPYSYSIAWGDVDNDGDLDLALAAAGWFGGTIFGSSNYVFINTNGVIEQNASWSSFSAGWTMALAWGDVDGDGDLDLAEGNAFDQNELYLNIGGYALDRSSTWNSGMFNIERFTNSLAFGDIDDDGHLDIAVGNHGDGNSQTFTGENLLIDGYTVHGNLAGQGPVPLTGLGTSGYYSGEDLDTFSLAFGDVDGDGDLDLAVGNGGYQPTLNMHDSYNEVYLNSNGSFGTGWPSWKSNNHMDTRSVAWGDVDGDGDLDLAVGNSDEGSFESYNEIYINNGSGLSNTSSWTSVFINYSCSDTQSVAWGDIDNDGDLDLAVGNNGYNQVYLNTGTSLATVPAWTSRDSQITYSVAWGDIDGDGDLDLGVGNAGTNQIFLNNNGILSTTPYWNSSNQRDTRSIAWGDADGDGDIDLAVGNNGYPAQKNEIYLNSFGTLPPTPSWESDTNLGTQSVIWGDFEGDGDLDLAVGNGGYGTGTSSIPDNEDIIEIFTSTIDSDGDWILEDADFMISDPTQSQDFDDDGFGDNELGRKGDSCTGYWGDSWRDRWGCPDMDGDGQSDLNDAFMNRDTQWVDTDGDGLGDNWASPSLSSTRPSHWPGDLVVGAHNPDPSPLDFDNDGSEDEYLQSVEAGGPFDDCPFEYGTSSIDRTGCSDSDADGYSDPDAFWSGLNGADIFPSDSSQWYDTDEDGFGDNPFPAYQPDACPEASGNSTHDRFGCLDEDGDGYSTAFDFDDSNSSKWGLDSDGDGVGDNTDEFVDDASEWTDADGDNVGDNSDACTQEFGTSLWSVVQNSGRPDDRIEYRGCPDSDGDGYYNDADDCPLSGGDSSIGYWGCPDSDGDGIQNLDDGCPTQFGNSTANLVACPDSDGDGIADLEDPRPLETLKSTSTENDWDGDTYNNTVDVFPFDETQWLDADHDGLGDEPSRFSSDPYPGDYDNDARPDPPNFTYFANASECWTLDWPSVYDAFPMNPQEWEDFDGDCIGDNLDTDDDNDGSSDAEEDRENTNPHDNNSYPVDAFSVNVGPLNIDTWDLLGIFAGFPILVWLGFGLVTRRSRSKGYESSLNNANSKDELNRIAKKYEFALMFRLLAPHQAIRLERQRAELDDALDVRYSGDLVQSPPPPPPPGAVEAAGPPPAIEADRLSAPSGFSQNEQPLSGAVGIVDQSGFEWLHQGGTVWYRRAESNEEWQRYES